MDKSGSTPSDPAFRRFEVYQSCLTSIKGWVDAFFSAPLTVSTGVPLIHHPRFVHLMRGLHRLSTLEDPAWDRDSMKQTLDLIPTCDRFIEVFKTLNCPVSTGDEDDEAFSFGVRLFQNLKAKWQTELANMERTSPPAPDPGFFNDMQSESYPLAMNFFGRTWLDEIWNTTW